MNNITFSYNFTILIQNKKHWAWVKYYYRKNFIFWFALLYSQLISKSKTKTQYKYKKKKWHTQAHQLWMDTHNTKKAKNLSSHE